MLHLHRAERADTLADALADVLSDPLPDPFATEVVAVPAKGVERWLAQRLAHRLGAGASGDGVCAGIAFPSPGTVVAAAVAAVTGREPREDPWRPARAAWPLLEVLDAAAGEPWCAPLDRHLAAGPGRRHATARALAELFSSYAAHRPHLLREWAEGADAPDDLAWQSELWRRLRARIGEPGPAERMPDVLRTLADDPARVELPARLSLFGPTRLTTEQRDVLAALATQRDVHLWLPHPSPTLWDAVRALAPGPAPARRADPPARRADPPARRADPPARRADPSAAAVAHPLLSSLGRDVRELQVGLLACGPATDVHHPGAEPPPTLLGRLQRELRDDAPPARPAPLADGDRSVQVHACHGAHRQVEVLREVVLGLLAADPTLEPRDVLVMCPDVETFAPLISGAFGSGAFAGHPGQHLQVRLADRGLRRLNPLLDTLVRLLELADARLTASELLDLLSSGPVRLRFRLDDDDLARLRELVAAAGVRWGLDAAHRAPFALGSFGQNTWSAGLDRLLLGVAMGADEWLGTALPLEVESGDAVRVGRLAEFVHRVSAVLARLRADQPMTAWVEALRDGLDGLTATTAADEWQGAQARGELAEALAESGGSALKLSLADVRGLLAQRLRGRPSRAGFRTGTLTVATLVPMRSVPHRVVCLLGLDDGAFPRAGIPDGDDVLARDPDVGERDPRSEDRQLLLDAVGAATEHLVVVHSGADERTGARRPPAVPLGELLDAIAATAGADVVVRHPLQPFDARNFDNSAPFSFDTAELAGALAASRPAAPAPAFLPEPLPALPSPVVALDELVAFAEAPVRAFLVQRVGLPVFDRDADPPDALPVALDGLAQYQVGQRLLADRLAGRDLARCVAAEWRRGELPPGRLGEAVLDDVIEGVEPLVTLAARIRGPEPATRDIDVTLPDGTRVVGTIDGLYDTVLLRVDYARLKAKQRIRAWVLLLALAAADPSVRWTAVTLGRAARHGTKRSTLETPEDPLALLADLVALRRDGLRAPLPIATASAAAYAEARASGTPPDLAREHALREWTGAIGEGTQPAHLRVWGPGADPLSAARERFDDLALRVWAPLLRHERTDLP